MVHEMVTIPQGHATLGAEVEAIPFGWDNEFPRTVVEVASFEIESHDVTNQDYIEFVDSGGYTRRELWTDGGWERRLAAARKSEMIQQFDRDHWHDGGNLIFVELFLFPFSNLATDFSQPFLGVGDQAMQVCYPGRRRSARVRLTPARHSSIRPCPSSRSVGTQAW